MKTAWQQGSLRPASHRGHLTFVCCELNIAVAERLYLAHVDDLEMLLVKRMAAIRLLMLGQTWDGTGQGDADRRAALVAEFALVLPILRAMQDVPVPPSLQGMGTLVVRYSGSLIQWVTVLQQGMALEDPKASAALIEQGWAHLDAAQGVRDKPEWIS